MVSSIFRPIIHYTSFSYLHPIIALGSAFMAFLPLIVGLKLDKSSIQPVVDILGSISFVQLNMAATVIVLPCFTEYAMDVFFEVQQTKLHFMNVTFLFWTTIPFLLVSLFQFTLNPLSYAGYYPFIFIASRIVTFNLSIYHFFLFYKIIWIKKYCILVILLFTASQGMVSFGLVVEISNLANVLGVCSKILGILALVLLIYPSYKWFLTIYQTSNKMKQLTETQYVGTVHLIGFWIAMILFVSILVGSRSQYNNLNTIMINCNVMIRIIIVISVVTINTRIIRRRIAIDQVRFIVLTIIIYNFHYVLYVYISCIIYYFHFVFY